MSSRKTVVIVGGGCGGNELLQKLGEKKYDNVDVILISKTNFYYHNIASPRSITDESLISKICIPFDNIINGCKKFIHGKVTKVYSNEIAYLPIIDGLEKEEVKLAFDFLVLALGSSYNEPFCATENDRSKQIEKMQKINNQIKEANRILVLGGGPVGVETAGEIATDYPNKKVTLITKGERLISSMSNSFSTKSLDILRQKNVDVIFSDSVDLSNHKKVSENQKVTSKNGKLIEFDAYIECTGSKPCTDIIKQSFPEWLNSEDRIQVTAELFVKNTQNIFAIGDCCDTDELKLAFLAGKHANVVAHNINQILSKKTSLQKYKPGFPLMGMSVGRDNGVLQVSCVTVKGFIPKMLKSRDLFIPRTRAMFGYSS